MPTNRVSKSPVKKATYIVRSLATGISAAFRIRTIHQRVAIIVHRVIAHFGRKLAGVAATTIGASARESSALTNADAEVTAAVRTHLVIALAAKEAFRANARAVNAATVLGAQ